MGIFGEFIKNLNLQRTQVFDPGKGLVEDHSSMASSPSSYFLLIINNHQLIYFPKTPHAPRIGEFESTASDFIKRKHKNFIDQIYDAHKNDDERVTKKSLYEQIPIPNIDVVPLATSDSVASFIARFSILKSIGFKLLKPNPTISAKDTFGSLQGIPRGIACK